MQAAPIASGGPPRLIRRTYVLDRGFQLKYSILLALLGSFVSLTFGGMMYLGYVDAQSELAVAGAATTQLAQGNQSLLWWMVAVALLMGVALGLTGILITHRVAGPVYVMNHYMQVLAKGRYPMMRPLRKSDELKSFFEQFQSAIESLRQREVTETQAIERAIGVLVSSPAPEGKALAEELKAVCQRKRDATDQVNVGGKR